MNLPLIDSSFCKEIWDQAHKQAKRSTLGVFKTGAVIFDDGHNVVSKGCSHHVLKSYKTVHAEEHAIAEAHEPIQCNILIITLGRAGNWAYSSKPCQDCAERIVSAGIKTVYWPEKDNGGWWVINKEDSLHLLDRALESPMLNSDYAKDMRIL